MKKKLFSKEFVDFLIEWYKEIFRVFIPFFYFLFLTTFMSIIAFFPCLLLGLDFERVFSFLHVNVFSILLTIAYLRTKDKSSQKIPPVQL